MKSLWVIQPAQPELAQTLSEEHNVSPIVAQLLINRGLTDPDTIRHFFHSRLSDLPDPLTLPDIAAAIEVLADAIATQKKIVLFGDYDVDGMTGTAILYLFLQQAGATVSFYIPDRQNEGYGLSLEALEKIHQQGCDLLVTIDNGTSAFEELAWAAQHDIQSIVIDHHESPTERPACVALVNPKHPASRYPDKTLCSAGLAFNLVIALRAHLRGKGFYKNRTEPDLRPLLDLVCLGTTADLVPLQGQNRLLVRTGLQRLNQGGRPGLAALKEVSGITSQRIGTYEIGFMLAPRLNAAGRLADAKLGVQLLTTEDRRQALKIATELNRLNQERRVIEQQMLTEAVAQTERFSPAEMERAIVVASSEWHPGVMGIVASRLVRKYHRPACVIALQGEKGMGSARSFANLNLYEALTACSSHLLRFGGHQAAAGFSITKDQVSLFRQALQEAITTILPEGPQATLQIDQQLACDKISPTTVNELERLAPFGMGNPEPLFASDTIQLRAPSIVGERHLKVTVAGRKQEWPAIGFGLAPFLKTWNSNTAYQVAYRPQWNEFRGERSIQLVLEEILEV